MTSAQRRRAAVIELQTHRDGAHAGAAGGLKVVNAADCRHDALDRRGQETANGLGAGACVHRRDHHRRALDLRILLHGQARQCPLTDEQDHEIDNHRKHGTKIRSNHDISGALLSVFGCSRPARFSVPQGRKPAIGQLRSLPLTRIVLLLIFIFP